MIDLAERFVADWIEDYVKKVPLRLDDPHLIERLALRLENDAWDFGLDRRAYLDAVNGSSHELVSFEVEKATGRNFTAWA